MSPPNPSTVTYDPEIPDPNYQDDGSPVTVTISRAQTSVWKTESEMGERYRQGLRRSCEQIAAVSGKAVTVRSYSGRVLFTVAAANDNQVRDAQ